MSTNGPTTPPSEGPAWVQSNPRLGIFFAFVIITLYVAPVYLIAGVAFYTEGFQNDSYGFEMFAAFIKSADSTLNQYHKVLMPILTAISVVVMSGRPTRGVIYLGVFLLFSFFVSLCVGVVFDMNRTITALGGLNEKLDVALVKPFFTRMQETLLSYFALLLGLGVAGAARKGGTK